jgi:16S rRNA (adenine1518-N6/adenine1519-N6)-dimethyltransferase
MAKLGQHFLTDQGALQDIIRASGVRAGDHVLEIGPGRGALTAHLLSAGATVTAVETDVALASALPQTLGKPAALTVIDEDFLRLDLSTLRDYQWIIVANLPYAVGTAILQKILVWDHWSTATLMFQKEVAQRLVSETGGPDYGLLTLSVKMRAQAELAFELPPQSFRPRPQVDSAVVLFRRLPHPALLAEEEKYFWRLAKAAFAQRRKMISGVLASALNLDRPSIDALLTASGISPHARPDQIPFDAWITMSRLFSQTATQK